MRTLTALLLSDDRPGHYHLSEGVIAAAQRLQPVSVLRLVVRRRWSGSVLAAFTNAHFPADWLLRVGYGLSAAQIPHVDFVVSAGAETLAANIAVARLTGAPNIFCGTLRRYKPDGLRLVLTSYASHAQRPRHVMVLKPSALNREALGRRFNGVSLEAPLRELGLLIGGDSRECQYQVGEWQRLLDLVERAHQTLGVRWHISNSRRTPASVSDLVAQHAAHSSGIASFVDVRVAGHGTLDRVLGRVHAVLCTDDSSTMISECVSAGIPVLGARPILARFTPVEQGYRQYLADNGWYRSVPIADLTPQTLLDELAHIRPLTEDTLEKLAAILCEHLPELFLQTDGKVAQKIIKPKLPLSVPPPSAPLPFPPAAQLETR